MSTTDPFVSLWAEASRDIEAEGRLRAQAVADVALNETWPFFAVARSRSELEHRKVLARDSLERVAAESGLTLAEVAAIVDRRHELLAEALRSTAAEEEGGKEFYVVDKNTGAKVAGPFDDRERALAAIEENDSGLPSSELTIEEESSAPEEEGEEKEASLRREAIPEGENILAEMVNDASGAFPQGDVKPSEHCDEPDENIPPEARGRVPTEHPGDSGATPPPTMAKLTHAEVFARAKKLAVGEYVDPSRSVQPPLGTQEDVPPADTGMITGMPPETPPMPGEMSYPVTTKPRQIPGAADGSPGNVVDEPMDNSDDQSVGQVTSARRADNTADNDSVAVHVDRIAAAVQRDNPHVSEVTARRVARKAVARLLEAAGDDGIDYVDPEIPKPSAPAQGPQGDGERGLGEHAVETAGTGMVVRKVVPELLTAL